MSRRRCDVASAATVSRHAFEQHDRMGEHLAAQAEQRFDFQGADAPVGELDRGLDGGEREALDAVTVELEVAHLRREQRAVHGRGVVVTREQRAVAFVHALENRFVVPEGVVGIEADHGAIFHAGSVAREPPVKASRGVLRTKIVILNEVKNPRGRIPWRLRARGFFAALRMTGCFKP